MWCISHLIFRMWGFRVSKNVGIFCCCGSKMVLVGGSSTEQHVCCPLFEASERWAVWGEVPIAESAPAINNKEKSRSQSKSTLNQKLDGSDHHLHPQANNMRPQGPSISLVVKLLSDNDNADKACQSKGSKVSVRFHRSFQFLRNFASQYVSMVKTESTSRALNSLDWIALQRKACCSCNCMPAFNSIRLIQRPCP